MKENAMHDHMITISQDPTQIFQQNHKNPKDPNKIKKLGLKCMNCMKNEEKKGFRPFTNELELGLG